MKWKLINIHILDDPQWGMLEDFNWRIAFSLLMICDKSGRLPDLDELLFVLRVSENDLLRSLSMLEKKGLVSRQNDGLHIDIKHIGQYQQLREEWLEVREEMTAKVFERDGKFCRHCGTTEKLTIDHIYPLIKGGSSNLDNLQVLCRSCNSKKGAR